MTPAILILMIFAAVIIAVVVSNIRDSKIKRERLRKTYMVATKHLDALSRRRLQLIRKDPYGTLIYDDWFKELLYFINTQVIPTLSMREAKDFPAKAAVLAIDKMLAEHCEKNKVYQSFRDDMSPSEFETFCAEALRDAGWDARVTMRSRDQGVDIIADKDDLKIVVQCKLYARPVGNKAVQEIAAARLHEVADFGVVVSNNRYTVPAEQLAKTNDVLLLHYTDLPNIDAVLSESGAIGRGVPILPAATPGTRERA